MLWSRIKFFFTESRIPHPFLWAIFNQGMLSLGAALTVIFLSYFLSQQDFGSIRYLSSVLAVFAFFSLPGVGLVVMKDSGCLTRRSFLHALTIQFKWGLVASFGGILFGLFNFFYTGNIDLGIAFIAAGLLAPLANLYLMPGQALASMKAFRKKALVDSFIIFLVLFGASLGAIFTKTVSGTTIYYFGTQAFITFLAIVWTYANLPEVLPDSNATSDVIFGKHLTLVQIPAVLLSSIERIIVYQFLGPLVFAVFVIASMPAEHTKNALRSFLHFYVLPQMKKNSVAELGRWMKLALMVTFSAVITLLFILPFVFPFLFPKYVDYYKVALLLTVIILPIPFQVMTLYWTALKRTSALFQYAVGVTFLNVVIFIPLTAVWGFAGAVAAKILFEMLSALLIMLVHRRVRVGDR